jgi:5-methylcytosine-specific restriction endonuclease McrA
MSNRWGIPLETEEIVRKRDLNCVYCGIEFTNSNNARKSKPTWEHIINDIRINGPDNIALCCFSCNASKGAKRLEDWLKSNYCSDKKISKENVAHVVKIHLI